MTPQPSQDHRGDIYKRTARAIHAVKDALSLCCKDNKDVIKNMLIIEATQQFACPRRPIEDALQNHVENLGGKISDTGLITWPYRREAE